jgi:hypothetical protein
MQQLLMDNILPMAHRRLPKSIATTILKEPGIEYLLKYYDSSLSAIFKHFAAASDQLAKDRNMVKATQHIVRTFDDQVRQIQRANARCVQQNSVSKMMSYADFLKFTSDLGLVSRYVARTSTTIALIRSRLRCISPINAAPSGCASFIQNLF